MPLYTFRCDWCEAERDLLMATVDEADDAEIPCRDCRNQRPMKRVPAVASFRIGGRFTARNGYSGGGDQ